MKNKVEFDAVIHQFGEQGEKSSWTYIDIPADIANQLKAGFKKTYRVKGSLDTLIIKGLALNPMGDGNFILALKAEIRKALGKGKGAILHVILEEDTEYKIEMPEDLLLCFEDEKVAFDFFNSLAKSHREYFIKWIESAKTEETRTKRIAHTIMAMAQGKDYGTMLKSLKAQRN